VSKWACDHTSQPRCLGGITKTYIEPTPLRDWIYEKCNLDSSGGRLSCRSFRAPDYARESGDWEVIGEARDGEQGLAQAKRFQPDIAVVDIGMPKMNGLTLTREIRRLLPRVEVLIVTDHDSRHMRKEAQAAGARGYVVKSQAGSHLLAAVQALSEHRVFFTSDLES